MGFGGSVLFRRVLFLKNLILIVSVFLFSATNAFCSGFLYHSDGPYKGKVIDLETGEPIEGAVVTAVWTLTHRFCDAKETVTDRNGGFILPKGFCFSLWPFTKIYFPWVVVFKPGYLAYPPLGLNFEERKARMPGFTGHEFQDKNEYNIIRLGKPKTRMEREFTYDEPGSLFTNDEAFEKLPILLKLINEERKNLGLPGKVGR
jgi:hypothetical protein